MRVATIKLYTTEGCHLCDEAAEVLAATLAADAYALEEVEISESDELMARYGVRIPVLALAGVEEELGWPFGQEELRGWLRRGLGERSPV